jgi:membrane-bound inhibitor of C-type lysozyme
VGGTRYSQDQTFLWERGSTHTLRAVTPQNGSDGYIYTFDHWSDGGAQEHTVTPQEDTTYTVYYVGDDPNVTVTVEVSPQSKGLQVQVGGTRYTDSQTFTWQKGSAHTLRAVTPQTGSDGYTYTFDRWSDGGAEEHTVSPQEDTTYTVYYAGDNPNVTVTVAVSPQGKGVQVEVGGTRYTDSQTFTWQKGSTHTLRAVTPQTGNDAYNYTFDHWSDGGAEEHTVSPQEDTTYTAYYNSDNPNVTVTVEVSPQGKGLQIEVGGTRYTDSQTFTWLKGSTHTLRAVTPQTGNDGYNYTFDRWSDGGGVEHTVSPQEDTTYTAYYTGDNRNVTVTVGISPQGKGLQVQVGGTRYTQDQTFTWQKGSTHTLRAITPQNGSDGQTYTFYHWSDGGAEQHTVTPQEDATYTVYYAGEEPNVTVNVAVSPQGKGLQVEVGGTRYTDGQTFVWQRGSTHTLKALTPQTGNDGYTYAFDCWSDGGAETHAVTPLQDTTYTVSYGAPGTTIPDVNLTLSPTGDVATLTWNSLPGRSYSVYHSEDLFTWHLAEESVFADDDGTSWIDDGSETGVAPSLVRRRFYRILENP